ncbi:MAG: phage holin family protein [Candidatus Omnitrophota bacterium]
MPLFIQWIINVFGLMVVVWVVPGIQSQHWLITVIAALVLGVFNIGLKPVILLLTLPINFSTLGIFTLFINGFMLYLVSRLIDGFSIANFSSAFWGALLLSMISFLLNLFVNPSHQFKFYFYGNKNMRSSPHDDVIDVEATTKDDDDKQRINFD